MLAIFKFLNDQAIDGINDSVQFDFSINQSYLEDIKRYSEFGLFPTVYVKTEMTQEQTAILEVRINDAMSLQKDQVDKIESTLLSYLTTLKLNILGIIGTQEVFNFRDTLVIEDLMKNGVKVWMMSKEDELTHVVNCNALRLLQQDSQPMIINGETEKDVEEQIKKCLNLLADGEQDDEKGSKLKYSINQTQQIQKFA